MAANTQQINQIYQSMFGRAPDAAGLAYWEGTGLSGDVLARDISGGAQTADRTAYETQISTDYRNLFGRAADPTGLKYWEDTGLTGTNLQQAMIAGASPADLAYYQSTLTPATPTTTYPVKPSETTGPITGTASTNLATTDPYAQYRAQAADQLNALVNNPYLAMSGPGYQATLGQGLKASERGAAASGSLASGGELASLSNLGQSTFSTYYQNKLNELQTLSGASQAPASAATAAQNIAASQQTTAANVALTNQQVAQSQAQSELYKAQARLAGSQTLGTNLSSAGDILGSIGAVANSDIGTAIAAVFGF
jgi:hypothetical protein